jgi:hypothetical protein
MSGEVADGFALKEKDYLKASEYGTLRQARDAKPVNALFFPL